MFKRLSLQRQLATGFSAVAGMFMLTLLIVGVQLVQLQQGINQVGERSLPLILAVDEMDLARSEVQQFLTDVSATHDEAGYKDSDESAQRFHVALHAVRKLLEQDHDTARLAQLAAIEVAFKAFDAGGKAMAAAYVRDGIEAGNVLMKGKPGTVGFDQASSALAEQLKKFRSQQLQLTQDDTANARRTSAAIERVMVCGGVLASTLAAVFALLVVRTVVGQLGGEPREAVRVAERVGRGDLSCHIELKPGDTASLMAHLKSMQAGLASVVHTVRHQAHSVELASIEIEKGSGDLCSRTSTQASTLQETAASMEQINVTVRQSEDGARQARTLAAEASTRAAQGGEVVTRFVDTMAGIDEASRKIADIIGVIDGIAFQTNILALNAAVEAARAGEQGRGFAVVASEVRSLAGRSAEAARAVKALIGTSVARVEEGSRLVVEARAAMDEIVSGIDRVAQTMVAITTASSEQSAGVSQVTEAVQRMDEVTQRNASLVDESTSAAVKLRRQAGELAAAVAVFKLGAERGDAGAPGLPGDLHEPWAGAATQA